MAGAVRHKHTGIAPSQATPSGSDVDGANWLEEHVFASPEIGALLVGNPVETDGVSWINNADFGLVLTARGPGVLPAWIPAGAAVLPITVPGGLIVGDALGAATELAPGPTASILVVQPGGLLAWVAALGPANIITTRGDLIVGDAANQPVRLPRGATDEVLTTLASGDLGWGAVVPGIPAGTRMLFDQAAAPAGWTRDATINDRVVRIVSGVAGVNAGTSWAISGLSHTHTHTMPHTHNMAHTHDIAGGGVAAASTTFVVQSGTGVSVSAGNHIHSVTVGPFVSSGASASTTGNSSAPNTGAESASGVASDGTWRPLTRDLIVASKN